MKYMIIHRFDYGRTKPFLFKTKKDCIAYVNKNPAAAITIFTIHEGEFKQMKINTEIQLLN